MIGKTTEIAFEILDCLLNAVYFIIAFWIKK